MSAERVQAFLRTVLRSTWIPVCAVAWTVAADLLRLSWLQIPAAGVAPLVCLACTVACGARIRRRSIVPGLVSVAICAYAGYVAFLVGSASVYD